MKVRGIVFSGVMSAILMSVAGADAVTAYNLASKDYVDTKLGTKQNVLTAGEGIDITNNVVKSTIDTSVFARKDEIPGLGNFVTDDELEVVRKALQDEIAAKQALGDYATAAQLAELQQKVEALQTSNVDKTDIDNLKAAVETISANYAKKSELAETEARLQNAIDAIVIPNLTEYAKSADVAAVYATKESLADYATIDDMDAGLLAKANVSALADYAKKNDLQAKADVSQLNALQQTVSDNAENIALKANIADVYTKTQVDDKVAEVVAGDMDEALKSYAKVADVESTYATKQVVETIAGRVDVMENSDFQTGDDVQGAITTAVADLATKAELADYATKSEIPSIEELATSAELTALEALVNAKATQADMTVAQGAIAEVQTAISNLQSGKADVATVTALQNAVNNLSGVYASDAELAAAIDDVVALIPVVPTDVSAFTNDAGYITSAALEDYATKSEIPSTANLATKAELETKADASALNDLVTSEELATLRTNLEAQIAQKQAAGDYATATALTAISDSLADYAKTSNVYTKAEVDEKIAGAASGGNIDLSGYATTSALEALQILVNGKQDTITDLATIRAGAEKGATAVQPGAITTGTENGSIAVDGTDVPVKGLRSAAYASVDSLVEKPALPTTDGDYLLMVSYQEGVHTYSWEDATKFTTGGTDEGWDDSGW